MGQAESGNIGGRVGRDALGILVMGRTRALLALAKVNCLARRLTNVLLIPFLNSLFKQKFDLFV